MTPTAQPRPSGPSALEAAFARYHAAWEANDPDRIAALHSADSVFWLHDGGPCVEGRENIRRHYVGLFERFESMAWEPRRVLYGQGRWVFDYTMVLALRDGSGGARSARVDMVDVIDLNADFEVTRKEVFLDAVAAEAALAPS